MIVRLPEIEIGVPSRTTLWSWLGRGVIAVVLIAGLVVLADWRLNSRLDRSSLEKLAADTATEPATTSSTTRRRRQRPAAFRRAALIRSCQPAPSS